MFCIAGILADEEPRTPITPTGDANSSNLGSLSSNSAINTKFLGGLSEFTLMYWVNIGTSSVTWTAEPFYGTGNSIDMNLLGGFGGSSGLTFTIDNSNGGVTTVTHNFEPTKNEWILLGVTGSVSNNRVRIYINGVLEASAVMTYPNGTLGSHYFKKITDVDIAQFNAYDRELTEAEMLEHYVYDEDTMESGVLGFDAMTPAQKADLIYSISMTEDISYDGNEFYDKSGEGVTITNNPTFTGEQIYVYTNASDLPSATQIYNVNSATLDGSSQFYQTTYNSIIDLGNGNKSFAISFKTSSANRQILFSSGEPVSGQYYLFQLNSGGTITIYCQTNISTNRSYDSIATYNDGNWHRAVIVLNGFGVYQLYIDGVLQTLNISNTGTITTLSTGVSMEIGARDFDSTRRFNGGLSFPVIFNSNLDQSGVDSDYNGGDFMCYEEKSTAEQNNILFAPRLSNYNGNNGQETTDQSSSGITTTAIGAPTYTDQGLTVECDEAPAVPINAMALDDTVPQYVDVANTTIVNGLTACTVACRVKFNTLAYGVLFSSEEGGVLSNLNLFMENGSGDIRTQVALKQPVNNVGIIAGQWYDMVMTFSGSNYIKLFLDGVEVVNDTSSIPSAVSSLNDIVHWGKRDVGGELDGNMYGLTIWNRAISLSEAQSRTVDGKVLCYDDWAPSLKSGCIQYLRAGNFGTNAGSELTDQSGNGNNGTAIGAPSFDATGLTVECS